MTMSSSKSDPILSVQGLTTTFQTQIGKFAAVEDLSFEIDRGECLGIVGESGSGKSVASLSIMGLISRPGKIEKGTILFEGQDLLRLDPGAFRDIRGSRLSIVFQDPQTALNPLFTIDRQMTDIVRAHRKISRAAARAIAVSKLKLVGISDPETRLRAYPWELSGGLQQRVAIAMSLLLDPSMVIADEPTTALDVSIQMQIIELLRQLKHELKFSLIFVSHDLGVISSIADRVIVMYAGRAVEAGPVQEVFSKPHHPYTAALLESAPTLTTLRTEPLQAIEGTLPTPNQLPPGCVFAPRCPYFQSDCALAQPLLESVDKRDRSVACLYPLNVQQTEVSRQ